MLLLQLSRVMTGLMSAACVFGVVTNLLSLIVYTRPTFRKKSINVMLSALSASDLCVCVLAIPVFASNHLQAVIPGYVTAVIMVYAYPVTIMFQSMSVWLLVSITIDRYLAVCHPFMVSTYCTRWRAIAVVALIVVFSVAYNVVRFWEYCIVSTTAVGPAAVVEEMVLPLLRDDPNFMLWYQNVATLLSQFLLPLVVLCVLNLQVARTILRASEQRRELVASERREHSTAKMMMMVVVVFLVCYTFSFVLNVAEILWADVFRTDFGYLLNDINNVLVVVNSSSAFIFYYNYSTRFRKQASQFYGMRWLAARRRRRRFNKREKVQYQDELTVNDGSSVCLQGKNGSMKNSDSMLPRERSTSPSSAIAATPTWTQRVRSSRLDPLTASVK